MRILTGCVMMVLCLNAALVVVCRGESLAIQNIQGIWTRQTYVETVRVTRSPFSERPETVTIQDGKFYWATYHEGAWRKIIRLEADHDRGIDRLVLGEWETESPGPDVTVVPFKPVINRQGQVEALVFLDNTMVEHPHEPFVKIATPLEQVVAAFVLVGTYQDQQGQRYVFAQDGIAQWPNQRFLYRLALDDAEGSCDYFFAQTDEHPVKTQYYGFQWVEGTLELFNLREDDQCEKHPFVILTPK